MTDSAHPAAWPARRGCKHAIALASLLFVAGCGTPTPAPRYHTLLPAPDGAPATPAAAKPGWEALTIVVPPQVDRPEWVVRAADGALAVLDDERWAAALTDEIGAAIADRLRRAAAATSLPAGRKPWRVSVDIQRFESWPGRAARIDAEWSLRPGDGSAGGWRCRGAFEQPAAAGYVALAAAHRQALQRLGDAIAAGLAAGLGATTAPVCAAAL